MHGLPRSPSSWNPGHSWPGGCQLSFTLRLLAAQGSLSEQALVLGKVLAVRADSVATASVSVGVDQCVHRLRV